MRLTWRNKLSYVLLGVAALHYVLGGFSLLSILNLARSSGEATLGQEIQIIIGWLTAPVTIIAWAAVVEYLSRIADALQRLGAQAMGEPSPRSNCLHAGDLRS